MPVLRKCSAVRGVQLHRRGGVFGIPVTDKAEDPPEGATHLIVPVRVDYRVYQRVDLCQQKDIFLHR